MDPDAKGEERIDGVTVVFVARHPQTWKTYIVGWYRDATVYRNVGNATLKRAPNFEIKYQVVADPRHAKLLAEGLRSFPIPTEKIKGNMGQSPLWYGRDDTFRASVMRYIESIEAGRPSRRTSRRGSPRQQDPELRKKVEEAAVNRARDHFAAIEGYVVRSVERDRAGWDLEVTTGVGVLKVEVKGLLGRELCVELTPNEYDKMLSREHYVDYVIFVVTEAVSGSAKSHIFFYSRDLTKGSNKVWATEDLQRTLVIKELRGARLTVATV